MRDQERICRKSELFFWPLDHLPSINLFWLCFHIDAQDMYNGFEFDEKSFLFTVEDCLLKLVQLCHQLCQLCLKISCALKFYSFCCSLCWKLPGAFLVSFFEVSQCLRSPPGGRYNSKHSCRMEAECSDSATSSWLHLKQVDSSEQVQASQDPSRATTLQKGVKQLSNAVEKTFRQLSEQDIASTPPPRSGAATDANTGGRALCKIVELEFGSDSNLEHGGFDRFKSKTWVTLVILVTLGPSWYGRPFVDCVQDLTLQRDREAWQLALFAHWCW